MRSPPREEGRIITAGNSVNKIKEYIITNRDWLKAVLSRQRRGKAEAEAEAEAESSRPRRSRLNSRQGRGEAE